MDRSIRILGMTLGWLALAALLGACGEKEQPPAEPKVVSQKITVPANQPAAPAPVPQPVAATPSEPAAAQPVGVQPAPVGTANQPPTAAPGGEGPAAAPPVAETAAVPGAPSVTVEPPSSTVSAPPVGPPPASAPAAVPAPAAIAQIQVEAATYLPEGRIDPFVPLFKQKGPDTVVDENKDGKSAQPPRIPRGPLEQMDLSQFKLVGIVQSAGGNRALVEDASGKGYVITKGTYIGLNAGIVVDIQRDKVVIQEEVKDLYDNKSLQEKELKLQKPLGDT